ncbi:MAG: TonB family protein [bacterium]|nr:TonB family protein [bacterium]
MESKINYHVLSMDEIVFDNRNKNYGAFILRQTAEKNQLRALFICSGFFISVFFMPAILRSLGLIIETIKEPTVIISQPMSPIQPLKDEIKTLKTPVRNPPKSASHPTNSTLLSTEIDTTRTEVLKPNPNTNFTPIDNGPFSLTIVSDPNGSGPSQPAGPEKGPGVMDPYGYEGELPSYFGGQDAFDRFIEDHLIYPEAARIDELEGDCEIRFVVNTDGSLEQISVSKSSHYKVLDDAAIALVKKMPRFNPGKQNGQKVRVWCIIPLSFNIN